MVELLGGGRCRIDVESFQNDITSFHSADDVVKTVHASEELLKATLSMEEDGINFDKKSRKHPCRIEKFEK